MHATVMIRGDEIVQRSKWASYIELVDGVLTNVKGPHGERTVYPDGSASLSKHDDGVKVALNADWSIIRLIPEPPEPEYDGDGNQVNEWPEFPDPVWPDIDAVYADTLRRIKQAHADALADARDRYSDTEREGWHELIKDAEVGEGSCIESYAEDLGVDLGDAIQRVLDARDSYRVFYGKATGKLTKLRDQIDDLYESGDKEKLKQMTWE